MPRAIYENVGRFQIAMDDLALMQRRQTLSAAGHQRPDLRRRHLALLIQPVAERYPADKFHDDIDETVIAAIEEKIFNQRVMTGHPAEDTRFTDEGLDEKRVIRHLGRNHLDRPDLIRVFPVMGKIDAAHAAFAELAVDHIGAEQVADRRQGAARCGWRAR